MGKILAVIGVIVAVIVVFGAILVGYYNSMITAEQEVEKAQAQVEVQLQRRYDLIPNLVESVKAVLTQEQEVFGDIAEARTRYSGAQTGTAEKIEASNDLESAISRLLVIMENYPELKSDQTVQGLMDELAGTENRISVERQRYNDTVTDFNIMIKRFPANIVAKLFGFEERPLFEAVSDAEVAPSVDLSLE